MVCDNPYKDNCACDNTECSRHGKCCECVEFHKNKRNLPKCLRAFGRS